jgi:hypothetical protein
MKRTSTLLRTLGIMTFIAIAAKLIFSHLGYG